jgi:hypothetical protein
VIEEPEEDERPAKRVLEAGAELTGSVTGAVAGMLLAGPLGAVGGAIAGPVLASGLKEVARRYLSHREEARIGGAFLAAATGVEERLAAGEKVRTDGFFTSSDGGRSDGDEIIEGVLLAAQREHQERKVEYLGYLLANVSFESDIDPFLANWAIDDARELTWAQLVLLSAVGRTEGPPLPDVEIGTAATSWTSWGIHRQLANLGYAQREMIHGTRKETDRLKLAPINMRLREQVLSPAGSLLFQLMWLDRIPEAEVREVLSALEEAGPADGDDVVDVAHDQD